MRAWKCQTIFLGRFRNASRRFIVESDIPYAENSVHNTFLRFHIAHVPFHFSSVNHDQSIYIHIYWKFLVSLQIFKMISFNILFIKLYVQWTLFIELLFIERLYYDVKLNVNTHLQLTFSFSVSSITRN